MVDGVHLATQPSLMVVTTDFSVVTDFSITLTLVATHRWFSPGSSDGTLAGSSTGVLTLSAEEPGLSDGTFAPSQFFA